MSLGLARTGLILSAALALSACSSNRFGGSAPGPVARAPSTYNEPAPLEPAPAVPSGQVSAEPLPPIAGTAPPVTAEGGAIMADVPATPPLQPTYAEPRPAAVPASPSRSSVVGSWQAREASGASCRVTLSSSPALDLYRASAAGCQNKDLGRVTAWDFRDGEVYLYQPGGAVAARLRAGPGQLQGVLAKSGAPITLAR